MPLRAREFDRATFRSFADDAATVRGLFLTFDLSIERANLRQ
jgi:hypothetical protein